MKYSTGQESICSTGIVVNDDSGTIECATDDESLAKRLGEVTVPETAYKSSKEPDRAKAPEDEIFPRQERSRILACIISGAVLLLAAIGIIMIFAGIERGRMGQQTSGINTGGSGPAWKDDSSLTDSLSEKFFDPSASPSSGQTAPRASPSPSYFASTSVQPSSPTVVPTPMPLQLPMSSPIVSSTPLISVATTHLPTSLPTIAPTINASAPITFYIMGDIPYDAEQKIKLQSQLNELETDAKFAIHLGDITKATESLCVEDEIRSVHSIFKESPIPLKIIPGDNDWHKCPSRNDSWKLWYDLFYRFEDNWKHDLPVVEQEIRKENFSFYYRQVLFIGVHVLGGFLVSGEDDDGDDDYFEEDEYAALEEEWYERMDDCVTWTRKNIEGHADNDQLRSVVIFGHGMRQGNTEVYFDALRRMIIELLPVKIPVYYIHGDGHYWSWDKPFDDVPNFVDVMVDNGNESPPLKVTLNGVENEHVFNFDRQGGKYE